MLKLIKYLKPFAIPLVLAVLLLGLQAYGELTLPDYMSKMVNIGLQQGGIGNAAPEAIRESEFILLSQLMSEDAAKLFTDNYELMTKGYTGSLDYNSYVKKYPGIENEPVYILNTKNRDTLEKLENSLSKAMVALYGLRNMNSENSFISGADFDMPEFPEGADPVAAFAAMPPEARAEILKEFEPLMENLPESMLAPIAASFIKGEYIELGANIESVQNNFIFKTGAVMMAYAGIILVAIVFQSLFAARVGAGLGRNLRGKVFRKVAGFSNAEFDKFSTASLITRNTNDVQQLQQMMPMLMRIVIYAPLLAVGGIIKIVSTDVSMTWVIGLGVLAILIVVVVLFIAVFPKFQLFQKLIDKMNRILREALTGMPVIRAFGNQRHEEKRFGGANKEISDLGMFVGKVMSIMMPVMMIVMNGISLLIIWIGSKQVDLGNMQVGNMMAFMQYAIQILMSFMMMTMISMMLPRASVAANRIVEVLDSDVSITDPQNPESFREDMKGVVEFKNVSFKYPGAVENVLENISFTARPGEVTAIIGSTGSGKSTLVNLIPRFYDPTGGEVLVEGVNTGTVTQHDLRSRIGYVPQKITLFSGSVESNIKYADENMPDERMLEAADISQSREFIEGKEHKYHEPISQGGTNVSGGQKQRLSIARAIAKDPEIFIFDDSFSALDYKTDRLLRSALHDKLADRTVIIIAQRIGTIKNADKIIVMDEGRIVGMGKHKDLMESCEVYNQIALSQLSKEELENE